MAQFLVLSLLLYAALDRIRLAVLHPRGLHHCDGGRVAALPATSQGNLYRRCVHLLILDRARVCDEGIELTTLFMHEGSCIRGNLGQGRNVNL